MTYSDFETSQSTPCRICGEWIRWFESDYIGGDTEDDRFSDVWDKLAWHQLHDKICLREQKLKELGI